MSNSFDPKGKNLERYEIAEPASYATFSPPMASAGFALEGVSAVTDRGPYSEAWDDTGKAMPGEAGQEKFTSWDVERAEEGDERNDFREKRAIWIVHGMGQQIPFETVDSLTQGLLSVAKPVGVKPRLRTVKIGDQTMQRVELDVDGVAKDPNGKPRRRYELHLYESYWAPKTEGVAKLQDVLSLLLDGGLRALLNFIQHFQRAMFGGMEMFSIPMRTPIWIVATLLIVLALTIINGVILAAATTRMKLPVLVSTPLDAHWPQLTALASCMTAVAFTFGTILFLGELSKPEKLPRVVSFALSTVVWLALFGTVFVILGTASVMLLTMHLDWAPLWFEGMPQAQLQGFVTLIILICLLLVFASMVWRAHLRSSEQKLRASRLLLIFFVSSFFIHAASVAVPLWLLGGHHFNGILPPALRFVYSSIWVWPFLIALSAKIRTLLIQYAGDVAIYVTPNRLDRFDDVRNKIKELARDVASAVYLACKPGTKNFLYEHIAVVGHSLGSVIAYDTLNRLMLDDWLSKNHLGIANRTNSLVTFGSPLNKTAFFFTIQGKDTLHVRERLAATVQPIIQSYPKFRKFKWINVYSGNDVISGKLTFYDLRSKREPKVLPEAVHNVPDKDAAVPLVAHVDYWKNQTVWMELIQQIAP